MDNKIAEIINQIFETGMSKNDAILYAINEFNRIPRGESAKFKQFNERYDVGVLPATNEDVAKALCLVVDELREAWEEVYREVKIDIHWSDPIPNPDLPSLAKEFEDIRYITGERMTMFGWNVSAIGYEVHRSNMSKIVPWSMAKEALQSAQCRYPDAMLTTNSKGENLLRCAKTRKVIKPEAFYTSANITWGMVGYDK